VPDASWKLVASPKELVELGTETSVGAWLAVELQSQTTRKVELRLGSDDGSYVWLGGKEVLAAPGLHAYKKGQERAWVQLAAGSTPLFVRVEQGTEAWSLGLQILDSYGFGAEDLILKLPGNPPLIPVLQSVAKVELLPVLTASGFNIKARLLPLPGVEGMPELQVDAAGYPLTTTPVEIPAPIKEGKATIRVQFADGREELWSWPYRGVLHAQVLDALALLARQALDPPEPIRILGVWDDQTRVAAPSATPLTIPTLEWLATRLKEAIEAGESDSNYLASLQTELLYVMEALKKNQDPFKNRTGAFWLAYRSRLDRRPQPFAVIIPSSYDSRQAWPLMVGLHGLGSEPGRFIREMVGVPLKKGQTDRQAEREFLQLSLPDPSMILVAPLGRGDIAFRGPGEEDVLTVISAVRARYSVDPDAIHLAGVSMGGIGVFELAAHRPDIFASATSLCGAADIRRFSSISGKPVASFEVPVLAAAAAVEWAENLSNLPFTCIHGTKDWTNSIRNSEVMMERLALLKIPAVFERPELGHDVQSDAWRGGKLWSVPRPLRVRFPERTVFVTRDLWYRGAYGVQVDQVGDRLIQARVELLREGTGLRVLLENVRAFRLFVQSGTKTLIFGEQTLAVSTGLQAFKLENNRLVAQTPPAQIPPAGPLGRMRPEPRVVVFPTGDALSERLGRILAESWAAPNGIKQHSPQLVADTDWRPELGLGKDIVIIGSPTSNRAWSQLVKTVPLQLGSGSLVFQNTTYTGSDPGIVLGWPKSDDPHHILIILGATSPMALASARSLPRYLPDYLVFDSRLRGEPGAILGGRPVLGGGFLPG
jgi:predicted esterase